MYTKDKKTTDVKLEPDKREKPPEDVKKRLNPRYVFNNPDVFFRDLLMEQQEQA